MKNIEIILNFILKYKDMASNVYVDISTAYGLFFVSSPVLGVSLDTNPYVSTTFNSIALGTTSNMASALIPFGGPLSSGAHVLRISVGPGAITTTLSHGIGCLASCVFDGAMPNTAQKSISSVAGWWNFTIPFTV